MLHDEITPEHLFWNRRRWIQAAALAGSLPISFGAYRLFNPIDVDVVLQPELKNFAESNDDSKHLLEQGFAISDSPSSMYDITHFNNFLEFTDDQQAVAAKSKDFRTDGWTIEVNGLVERPMTFTLDQIWTEFPVEERVYRMRCIEAWSMVIPWSGFPLAVLLEKVRPTSNAKFVAFESLKDRSRMPNQIPGEVRWPYREGLRLDEALHPLTLIAIGLYRRELPPCNGAPIRLVVPWKYGIKSIKSIVKIELVSDQPVTAWNQAAPRENGFYANVNPNVDHPRWSQKTERRVGESLRRDTLLFNGYEKQVGHLYDGIDLNVHY